MSGAERESQARPSSDEVVALTFAQHYADSRESPSRDAYKHLARYYGFPRAREVLAHVQLITVGNLTGNTLDALRSRLRGVPPEHGSFLFELLVGIIGLPIAHFMLQGRATPIS